MKKKWYRSSAVKAAALVVGVASLTAAAAGGAASAGIMSEGVLPFDKKEYLESRSFEQSMRHASFDVLNAESEISYMESKQENEEVDLWEILADEETDTEGSSGLVYRLGDLEKWVETENWDAHTEDVLVCVKPDGNLEYMYYEDFEKKIRDGELGFLVADTYGEYDDGEYAEGYTQPEESGSKFVDALSAQGILACLKNHDYSSYGYYGDINDYYAENIGVLNSGVTGIADEDGKIIYTNVINEYSDYQIAEAFPPVGADSILDILNEEPGWKGRFEDAFYALNHALAQVQMEKSAEAMLKEHYGEGKTNLSYILALNPGSREEKIQSNTDAGDYEKRIQKLKSGQDPYVVVTSSPEEHDTNIDILKKDHYFNLWQHTVDNAAADDRDIDYVFAAWVDKDFAADDLLAEDAENFEKYAAYLTPSMAVCGAGILIFLICLIILTAGAGRNNEKEEVQLNFFDRWYTEIGAAAVCAVWAVPVFLFLGLGINVDYVDKLKYIVAAVAGLGAWTAVMFLGGWMSLVRRIKAKTFWKNSVLRKVFGLLRKLLSLLKKFCLKLVKGCRRFVDFFAENTASRIKMALLFGGFCFFQFILWTAILCGGVILLPVLLAVDILGLIYFLRKARGRELILDGLKRISDGELQYKIPLDKLTGEQRQIAEYINRIGEGLDAAVEESLKNERMKTELITNVSHDIKTPLTSIINYVDLLKRENPQDPKIQGYLEILEEKSLRLKTLTEDVVEASKASTGNISLEMADLNFVELVHQVIGEFEERFQEKNLSMMVHFDQDEAIICADGRRMWRVLENVFGNVAKYAMNNTRVYAEIKVNQPNVTFSLKNISAQPLNISADELTERFIRGDVSRNTEGSGLGLSIAKSLTELQGGEFKLYLDGDLFKVTITFKVKEK